MLLEDGDRVLGTHTHLALGGRREPFPLARLRAQGRIADLGPDDLHFDEAEAAQLLAATGTSLPALRLTALLARTEGWPVGLYFAALAETQPRPTPPREAAFRGDDRLLADYLRAVVLDRAPPEQLGFLTRTAFLDELTGPLCDAILERTGSASTLEELEAANLLIVPLDRQRTWYRYHHLFQDLLLQVPPDPVRLVTSVGPKVLQCWGVRGCAIPAYSRLDHRRVRARVLVGGWEALFGSSGSGGCAAGCGCVTLVIGAILVLSAVGTATR